jgi:hypothetical protein
MAKFCVQEYPILRFFVAISLYALRSSLFRVKRCFAVKAFSTAINGSLLPASFENRLSGAATLWAGDAVFHLIIL